VTGVLKMMACLSRNVVIYTFCSIACLGCIASVIASMSSTQWFQVTLPTQSYPSSQGDWSQLNMGLFRSSSRETTIPASNSMIKGSVTVDTLQLLDYYRDFYERNGCKAQATKFEDSQAMYRLSMALIVFALAFFLLAFVALYCTMADTPMFGVKSTHIITAALLICGTGCLVGTAIESYAKEGDLLSQECRTFKATWNSEVQWGYGLVLMSIILSFFASCAIVFRAPKREPHPEEELADAMKF
jgi:hypothetical protein